MQVRRNVHHANGSRLGVCCFFYGITFVSAWTRPAGAHWYSFEDGELVVGPGKEIAQSDCADLIAAFGMDAMDRMMAAEEANIC